LAGGFSPCGSVNESKKAPQKEPRCVYATGFLSQTTLLPAPEIPDEKRGRPAFTVKCLGKPASGGTPACGPARG
jgi:hypothetical protein